MEPHFKKEGHPTAERMLPSSWSRVEIK